MKRQRQGTSGNKNKKQVDHHDTVKNYRLWNRCTMFYLTQTVCTSTVTGSVFMPIFRFLAGLFLNFCKLIDRVNGVFYFFYTNFSDGDPYNIFFVHQQFFIHKLQKNSVHNRSSLYFIMFSRLFFILFVCASVSKWGD